MNEVNVELELGKEALSYGETVDDSDVSVSEKAITSEDIITEDEEQSDKNDSPPESIPEDNGKNELEILREEVARLRGELEEKKNSLERLGNEISEFSELFPDQPITSLPDSVWESVRSGAPLAAAYALYKKKNEIRLEKAGVINRKNGEMSTGALGRDTTENFYTPNEVRAMSRSEIRKNYSKISLK